MAKFTVFLDRDGVFNRLKLPGVLSVDEMEWLPGVKAAFARLNRPDIQTCLCTNQPMVGHLMAKPRSVRAVNAHLQAELAQAGGRLDHMEAAFSPVWFPHRRRKPRPGMLQDGAKWLATHKDAVDPARAVMIGDTIKDAKAAQAFGCQAILLATTHDEAYLSERAPEGAIILPDLAAAVDWVLQRV